MKVHDTLEDLPPLKIKRLGDQEQIEKDPTVKNLIETKNLLNPDFNRLYSEIAKKSEEIIKIMDILRYSQNEDGTDIFEELGRSGEIGSKALKKISRLLKLQDEINQIRFKIYSLEKLLKRNEERLESTREEKISYINDLKSIERSIENLNQHIFLLREKEKEQDVSLKSFFKLEQKVDVKLESLHQVKAKIKKLDILNESYNVRITDMRKDINDFREKEQVIEENMDQIPKNQYEIILQELSDTSSYIQKSIDIFEEKNNLNLDILSNTVIHSCKKCNYPFSFDRFHRYDCNCGEIIRKTSQTFSVPIYHFNKNLIKFVKKNLWLEYGVEYLLKRKGFDTWVGHHILGHSGVWHEIDNMAEYKNGNLILRIFGECKSGKFGSNDILYFLEKWKT